MYDKRPQLLKGLDFYLNAYLDLKYDRSLGFGVGPIPWSSVVKFSEIHDLDIDDLYELNYLIRAMEKEERTFDEKKEAK